MPQLVSFYFETWMQFFYSQVLNEILLDGPKTSIIQHVYGEWHFSLYLYWIAALSKGKLR